MYATDLVALTVLPGHKAKQRQRLGWFRLLKKLKVKFLLLPFGNFPPELVRTASFKSDAV